MLSWLLVGGAVVASAVVAVVVVVGWCCWCCEAKLTSDGSSSLMALAYFSVIPGI